MGFLLFAQSAADPLNGWGSLVLQGGFGGLLAYVLIRLAPAMLKDSREEREIRDKLVTEKDQLVAKTVNGLVDTHRQALQEVAATFERVNEKLVDHCDKEHAAIMAAHDKHIDTLIALFSGKDKP